MVTRKHLVMKRTSQPHGPLFLAFSLLSLSLALPACGSGGPTIPDELLDCCSGGGQSGGGEDYPEPPYGSLVGDTLEDFGFFSCNPPALALNRPGLLEIFPVVEKNPGR